MKAVIKNKGLIIDLKKFVKICKVMEDRFVLVLK
jgi:hypothetical protein